MNEWTPFMLLLALGISNFFMVGVSLTTNLVVSAFGLIIGLGLALVLGGSSGREKGESRQ